MHKYLPHTKENIEEMLKVIGASSIDELFGQIPQSLKNSKPYQIPSQMSDKTLTKHMQELASKNKELIVFRGAGSYDNYIPSAVKSLISRQEFLTSYTPYQPEVSQGTLHYIFEYQSMICELTGMDVSNASMYDGATATAEAMFMAYGQTRKNKILISATLNPSVIEVVLTYAKYRNIEVVIVPEKHGITDLDFVKANVADTMGLIVSTPNYYGIIEDYQGVADIIHEHKGLFIINQEGQSLALIKNAREYDADIACGELQALGIPMSFGGPYLGYLATKNEYVRKMPGRICGMTTDVDGKQAFVLTLQAREQHIRRAKANSNICSNQSLLALSVTIYLSLLGKQGFKQLATEAYKKAHRLEHLLLETKLFEKVYDQPYFNEFVLKPLFDISLLEDYLVKQDILGPLVIKDNHLLFAVTEKRTLDEINLLVEKVVAYHESL
ncbi:MAG: aminomethyl-transferring glycine dehydrogenase subunit GcvPA [Acholeplasmataceae bacterium]